jgi:hypothetical protein
LNGGPGNDDLDSDDGDSRDELNGGPGHDRCDVNDGDRYRSCEVVEQTL